MSYYMEGETIHKHRSIGMFGGSKSSTTPTGVTSTAGTLLEASLFPGIAKSGQVTNYLGASGAPGGGGLAYQSSMAGLPGIAPSGAVGGQFGSTPIGSALTGQAATTVTGSPGAGASPSNLPTVSPMIVPSNAPPMLLPSIAAMGAQPDVFQRADMGQLSPSAQNVFNSFLGTVTGAPKLNVPAGTGTVASMAGGGSIPNPAIPGVGELVTQQLQQLPPQFTTFINNVLSEADPTNIQAELDKLSTSIINDSQLESNVQARNLMSQFAAQGLGSSGSAMLAIQQQGIQIATQANQQIAQARVQALQDLIQSQQVATGLINDLLQSGQSEQADIVRQNTALMQAQASVLQAQIEASAQTQAALIAAQRDLQVKQMDLQATAMSMLNQNVTLQGQQNIASYQFPYEILSRLAGSGTTNAAAQSTPNIFGDILAAAPKPTLKV